MRRMRIRDNRGVQYLFRIRLIETPRFGLYLHHITGMDPQPIPHDHPWNFTSIVLSGGYAEEVYHPRGALLTGVRCERKTQYWGRWSNHKMYAYGWAHRIIGYKPNTWTLIIRGPREKEWGFWHVGAEDPTYQGFTHWKAYV